MEHSFVRRQQNRKRTKRFRTEHKVQFSELPPRICNISEKDDSVSTAGGRRRLKFRRARDEIAFVPQLDIFSFYEDTVRRLIMFARYRNYTHVTLRRTFTSNITNNSRSNDANSMIKKAKNKKGEYEERSMAPKRNLAFRYLYHRRFFPSLAVYRFLRNWSLSNGTALTNHRKANITKYSYDTSGACLSKIERRATYS